MQAPLWCQHLAEPAVTRRRAKFQRCPRPQPPCAALAVRRRAVRQQQHPRPPPPCAAPAVRRRAVTHRQHPRPQPPCAASTAQGLPLQWMPLRPCWRAARRRCWSSPARGVRRRPARPAAFRRCWRSGGRVGTRRARLAAAAPAAMQEREGGRSLALAVVQRRQCSFLNWMRSWWWRMHCQHSLCSSSCPKGLQPPAWLRSRQPPPPLGTLAMHAPSLPQCHSLSSAPLSMASQVNGCCQA